MEKERAPEEAAPPAVVPRDVVEAKASIERLAKTMAEVAGFAECRNAYKKQFCNLSRRIKLLAPMFEELRESKAPINERAAKSLLSLERAVEAAKELLRMGSEGSKIFLVLERDKIMEKFHDVTTQLAQVLGELEFDELEISDEIREQVELVHAQFKRAKERVDAPDAELYNDLLSIYGLTANTKVDSSILRGLAEKLHLMTISDLKQESLALHEIVLACEDSGEIIEKVSVLLKRIKDFMQTQSLEMGNRANSNIPPSDETAKMPVIPDDLRCPISLELMGDPVIVSTGQTYERVFIEKWLEAGHETCPKTQQRLSNKSLTPNYVLRSLIAQWCEANGMEPPKRQARGNKEPIICSAGEHGKVIELLHKLQSSSLEDQRSAAGELRLLAKRNAENRACIAEAGVIPVLVRLLTTLDVRTQEHAVTALLNLSIYEENKGRIMAAEAVTGIVHVLKRGSMEARENAAATLFSLSVVDRNKVIIGESGAIPPLAMLLREGSQRGRKDAATALFNLCIYQGNKGRAVRAGVIPVLMHILMDPDGAMLDEALAILGMLSSHPEGKASIAASQALPVMVSMIRSGSPRNKENAAAILLHLCNGEQQHQHLAEASETGVIALLQEMVENGTDRGKRKASQLLELMNRFLELQTENPTQAEGAGQAILELEQPAEPALSVPIDE